MRLDLALVERGLARSRTQAQSLIADDMVSVGGHVVRKPGADVADTAVIDVAGAANPYVSRGGLKLAAALDHFTIDVTGLLCLDVGASTGGFTDCLLQRGAKHVVAVDVGHGQMTPTLAVDPRVTSREGINARTLTVADFNDAPSPFQGEAWGEVLFDIIVADLSFISVTLVLPALVNLAVDGGQFVLLVKPQFEVGPSGIGKGGLVKDSRLRQEALERVKGSAEGIGLTVKGSITSPITGGDGNEEFLLWLSKETDS